MADAIHSNALPGIQGYPWNYHFMNGKHCKKQMLLKTWIAYAKYCKYVFETEGQP